MDEKEKIFREPGTQVTHRTNEVNFLMRLAPAATFLIGKKDKGINKINKDFWIAETPVTYELWYGVRMWAEKNRYTFSHKGMEGSIKGGGEYPNFNNICKEPTSRKREPVTMVNWYDSIIWCNALSEYLGYNPIYTFHSAVIRCANDICHNEVVLEDRDGFRLPTSMEWELAARYKGSDSSHGAIEYPAGSGYYWTPGSYASGATADYKNGTATQGAAWYGANSGGKTQDVGEKPPSGNGLGLFDQSGNVWEWCFTQGGRSRRVLRGGSWSLTAFRMRIVSVLRKEPGYVYFNAGFRFVRKNC